MNRTRQYVLEQALNLCKKHDCALLYLTIFGSELFGTNTGKSDIDVRGVYLPSLQSLILGEQKQHLHFSTGSEHEKNSAGDIDIDLLSLGAWILHLLPDGDTSALDLLFSPTNASCELYKSPRIDPVFANPLKFLDLSRNKAYAQYSLSQVRKYGIKGSRLGVLKAVCGWVDANAPKGRLKEHIKAILETCGNSQYCFAKELPDGTALVLCDKIHTGSIKMQEFCQRVHNQMNLDGNRAREAMENRGLDFKAISHALRALDEMEELLLTGKIVFPLATRDKLRKIKNGEITWPELEKIILARLAEVGALHDNLAKNYSYDKQSAENFILSCYGCGREHASNIE